MSTYVKDIKGEFPKAKAIIVGYKEGANKVKIDKIVLHTAFTLSDEPYLIENIQITPQDKLIYICGHGNASKQTIGGRNIDEIADFLIMKGWFGQQIYLTSCDSNMPAKAKKHKDKVICNTLGNLLEEKTRSIVNMSKYNSDFKESIIDWIRSTNFVYSDATGSTITIKDDNGEPQIYVIEFDAISEFLADFRTIFIGNKKTRLDSIEISNANFDYLRKKNKLYYEEMQQYKKELLMKYGFKKKTLPYKLKEQIAEIREKCNHSRYM